MKNFKQHLDDKYWDEGEVVEEWTEQEFNSIILEAEYQGKSVKLDKPFAGDSKHKRYVYVKNEKGNVIKLGFGDPNMEIRRDNPDARKSFRARHHCDTDPGPKWKARYWSCRFWSSTPVNKLD